MYYTYILLNPLKEGKYEFDDICFLNEPFYVGKGKNNRHLNHLYKCNINNDIKSKIIKKILLADEKPFTCINRYFYSEVDAFTEEIKLIKMIGKIKDKKGTLANITDGGEGISGHRHSKETLIKLSESHKGYKMPESQKRKIRESCTGQIRDITTSLNMSVKETMNVSDNMKKIISNKLKGNSNCKNKKKNYYRVAQLHPFTNEVISVFDNSVEASIIIKGNKKSASSIRKVCKGDRKTAIGYKWKYIE